MPEPDDPLHALSEAYVGKVNDALARGDLRLAAELADAYADEGLRFVAAMAGPARETICRPGVASRSSRLRRLWTWTAR